MVRIFFVRGEYIVISAYIFSQCIKYNDQYKDKNRSMEGMYSAFNITTKGDQLELSVYHIIKAIRLPLLKKLQDLQGQDLDRDKKAGPPFRLLPDLLFEKTAIIELF